MRKTYLKILTVEPKPDRIKLRCAWKIKPQRGDIGLLIPPDDLIVGRVMRVSKRSKTAVFITFDRRAQELKKESYLVVFKPWVAEVILNKQRK